MSSIVGAGEEVDRMEVFGSMRSENRRPDTGNPTDGRGLLLEAVARTTVEGDNREQGERYSVGSDENRGGLRSGDSALDLPGQI